MRIAIIGAGNVGSALGKGWVKAGHSVTFGVRDPLSPKTAKALEYFPEAIVKSVVDAAKDAEVIVITTPPEAVIDLVPQLGDLSGKTVIDTTNSIRTRPEPYPTAYHAIKALGKIESVVKCFNSTGFENMRNPVYQGEGIDMFMAGSDAQAKALASQLASDLGFAQCYDFGGDDRVELLEKLAFSWINLAIMQGHGRDIAFRVVRR